MQNSSTARGASSPFHIALHSSKKFAVYYTSEETHSRAYMPASISCQRAPIPANRFQRECLPVQGSATLVWSHVASNKKPGVERRAKPSLYSVGTDSRDARQIVYPVFVTNLTPSLLHTRKTVGYDPDRDPYGRDSTTDSEV
jgi:hypothetical protein